MKIFHFSFSPKLLKRSRHLSNKVDLVPESDTRLTRTVKQSAGKISEGLKNFNDDPRLVLLISI